MSANLVSASSITPKVIAATQIATANTETSIFTVAAANTVKIATACIVNTSGAAVTVNVSLCQSGQTGVTANRVVPGYSLQAGDNLPLDALTGAMLGPGDSVSVNVSAANAVNVIVTGTVSD